MMLWRSLSARTICQAADAIATRRAAKDKDPKASRPTQPASADTTVTVLPENRTRRGPSTA